MDDRYNICDACGKDIIEEAWSQEAGRSLPTGQKEIPTPETMLGTRPFGDGVMHESCLPKLLEAQTGAGI